MCECSTGLVSFAQALPASSSAAHGRGLPPPNLQGTSARNTVASSSLRQGSLRGPAAPSKRPCRHDDGFGNIRQTVSFDEGAAEGEVAGGGGQVEVLDARHAIHRHGDSVAVGVSLRVRVDYSGDVTNSATCGQVGGMWLSLGAHVTQPQYSHLGTTQKRFVLSCRCDSELVGRGDERVSSTYQLRGYVVLPAHICLEAAERTYLALHPTVVWTWEGAQPPVPLNPHGGPNAAWTVQSAALRSMNIPVVELWDGIRGSRALAHCGGGGRGGAASSVELHTCVLQVRSRTTRLAPSDAGSYLSQVTGVGRSGTFCREIPLGAASIGLLSLAVHRVIGEQADDADTAPQPITVTSLWQLHDAVRAHRAENRARSLLLSNVCHRTESSDWGDAGEVNPWDLMEEERASDRTIASVLESQVGCDTCRVLTTHLLLASSHAGGVR